jgi:preprotein translocase subunit SecG
MIGIKGRFVMDIWWIAYFLIVVISIAGLVGTIMISKTQDEKYGSSTRQNLVRLTLIYAVVILVSIIALALYIYL